jgi:hypothetical protein
VPDDIRDAYTDETELARQVLAAIEAADGHVGEIGKAELERIVEEIERPPAPTREVRARQAAISDWFLAHCALETPEIAFTG